MMSKKDYERAALVAQDMRKSEDLPAWEAVVDAFVRFFSGDNPRFNGVRFRLACVPGANVKARG